MSVAASAVSTASYAVVVSKYCPTDCDVISVWTGSG